MRSPMLVDFNTDITPPKLTSSLVGCTRRTRTSAKQGACRTDANHLSEGTAAPAPTLRPVPQDPHVLANDEIVSSQQDANISENVVAYCMDLNTDINPPRFNSSLFGHGRRTDLGEAWSMPNKTA
eukprot:CAMPEP_0203896478 /NCGR_PEP_ID=MMETSP0359-20131031/39199_1 /ASSEMBLY_ACC=CAM_ASM_000338 /TAXON_ID=268821 /ORGANISM="Scrippsiella Hangoei, Strain SHTV-5" /LENGTH=124 /DNA_ID=CAMNT_0050819145 /DNA_START=11 /DNA_END=386 /DNA_ORIENTATION=-